MTNTFQNFILIVSILLFQEMFFLNSFEKKIENIFSRMLFSKNVFEKKISEKNSEKTIKTFHAFHFTKTEISFDEHNAALNMTMHIFIDDLEKALEANNKEKFFIGTEKENKEANAVIQNYLQKHFSLELDNKKINYTWVGKETAGDLKAIYIYLSVEKIKKFKQIHFNNTLLTEVFYDQKNIVQINLPNKPQGYFVFDKGKTTSSFSF